MLYMNMDMVDEIMKFVLDFFSARQMILLYHLLVSCIHVRTILLNI